MGAAKHGEAGRYLLTSFDADERATDRRGLSARDDAEALEQAERARWEHEAAGESRLLVLERADGGERAVVARLGSRRFEGVREVPEGLGTPLD
ncbi:hypothetical protein [Arabiibacter massiliensis]|uniref:hypothetical protein n=1 Tax=Arabiibacter massiliensis TaxID=1870985 RepID=UPI0009BB9A37|nr:hypothetical protein [Arabiibacter massiliensis]